MILGSENKILDSTIKIINGAVDSQFPLSEIKQPFTTDVARVSGTSITVQFEFAGTETIEMICLIGSSLEGFGYGSASIQFSLTEDFSSSTSSSISINQQYGFGYLFPTETVARFARLTFVNTGGFVEISKIFMGKKISNSEFDFTPDSFQRSVVSNDSLTENSYGHRYVDKRNTRDSITGTVPLLSKESASTLEKLFSKHKESLPIWVIADNNNVMFTDGSYKCSGYFYFNNIFSHNFNSGSFYDVDLEFISVA
ncbi:hypothetical protein [uncultured Mediterranean phage uvMED]|nr:hypothetical protein [uncultured Mediterranean phage uvMED]